jgi:hypothetical protein
MKKIVLLIATLLAAGTARAELETDRVAEVKAFFLKEANRKESSIGKLLNGVREELTNGFRPPEEVIPVPLKEADLGIQLLASEYYGGKIDYDENVHEGYDNGTVLITVTAWTTYYGGRIDESKAILFSCTYAAKALAKTANVACERVDLRKP